MPHSVLPADDLRLGDWVAIRDEVEPSDSISFDDLEPPMLRRRRRESSGPQPGIPLRILAIALPWVYVAVLDDDGDEVGPAILDIRRHPLVRMPEAIPEAIIAFGRQKREDAARREAEASRRKAVARARADFARREEEADGTPTGRQGDADQPPPEAA